MAFTADTERRILKMLWESEHRIHDRTMPRRRRGGGPGGGGGGSVLIVKVSSAPDGNGKMSVTVQAATISGGAVAYADSGGPVDAYADPGADTCNADPDGSYSDLYEIGELYWAAQVGGALLVFSSTTPVGQTANAPYVAQVYVDEDTGCFIGVNCRKRQVRGGINLVTISATGCLIEQ